MLFLVKGGVAFYSGHDKHMRDTHNTHENQLRGGSKCTVTEQCM